MASFLLSAIGHHHLEGTWTGPEFVLSQRDWAGKLPHQHSLIGPRNGDGGYKLPQEDGNVKFFDLVSKVAPGAPGQSCKKVTGANPWKQEYPEAREAYTDTVKEHPWGIE